MGDMIIDRRLSILSVAALAVAGATASTIEYSYNANGEEELLYGFGRKETYDVAIKIQEPGLTGARITRLSVILPVEEADVANLKGWLTSELKIDKVDGKRQNVADICTVEATCEQMMLTAVFPEPYQIPAEGVYVGYSFDITATGTTQLDNPVVVARGQGADGLWLHTSKSKLKWVSMSDELEAVSAMSVTVEGDFHEDAAGSTWTAVYLEKGIENTASVNIMNHGTNEIGKIDYAVGIDGQTLRGSHTFAEPIKASYGAWQPIEIELPVIASTGIFNMDFTIENVNGNDNNDIDATTSMPVEVLPFIPVNRPLVEEFTGLGCGYCPRGYVALEEMKATYGDEFVAMAYHSESYENGCMVTLHDTDFPVNVGGFPSGSINRISEMDPGMFPYVWGNYRRPMPEGDIAVSLKWEDETHTRLVARSETRFVRDMVNDGYRLSFALVADGLSDESWGQSNYYKGKSAEEYPGELWDKFINGESKVYGLEFNDVVVYYPDVKGIESSLPESFKEGEQYSYTWTIDTADVVNVVGARIVDDFNKTRVIGILLDPEGRSVNCISSGYPYDSGIDGVAADLRIIRSEYYDLFGRRISGDYKGICVRLDRLSDGSHRSVKTVR